MKKLFIYNKRKEHDIIKISLLYALLIIGICKILIMVLDNQTTSRIQKSYIFDVGGNKIENNSNYIAIEMHVSLSEKSSFFYDFIRRRNA